MLDDRSLINQLNLGSKQALHQIYAKYKEDMFTIAVSMCGDRELVEDCLQDVFVHFAEAAGQIRARSNLKAYLITAILNRIRDRLRRRDRWRRTSQQLNAPAGDFRRRPDNQSPAGPLMQGEQNAAIMRAMGKLPAKQREAFLLHAQADLTFRQIARHQQVSEKTVNSRYRYAVEKLQVLLDREERA